VAIGAGVLAGLSGGGGGLVGIGVILVLGLWGIGYLARLMWNTAERRGLPGPIGLLVMFPGVGMLLYPYIAFHDGLRPPNKLGLALGLLIAAGPVAAQVQMAETIGTASERFLEEQMSALDPDSGAQRDTLAFDPQEGFPVPEDPDCPAGTAERQAEAAASHESWCERVGKDAGLKHGWFFEYAADGRPLVAGEYRNGMRVGVWTRWHANGEKRAQAQFRDGMQHGVLLAWNEAGQNVGRYTYREGALVD
jgi:hypothetical protein